MEVSKVTGKLISIIGSDHVCIHRYKAYTTFAPGISSVDQKDRYYSCVTEENPDGDKVLENYTRYSTIKHDK
jgi:hypothetical protein